MQGRPLRTDLALECHVSHQCSADEVARSADRAARLRTARAVRARPRGAGRAADAGQAGRRGDRAGRRHDRGLRRRRPAPSRPCGRRRSRCSTRASRCCCASRPTPEARRSPGKLDGAQPVPVRRHPRDLPRAGGPAPLVVVDGDAPDRPRRCVAARRAARLRRSTRATASLPAGRRGRGRGRLARPRRGGGARRRAAGRRALRRPGRQPQARRGGGRRRSTSCAATPRRVHTPAGLDIGARTPEESRCRSWPRSSPAGPGPPGDRSPSHRPAAGTTPPTRSAA